MEKYTRFLKSTNIVIALFAVKMITYYCLIGVNILKNPLVLLSIALLCVLFSVLADGRLRFKNSLFLVLFTLISIVMFADTMYYNYYNQTVSVKQLWQVANVAKVPSSFVATLIPASFLLILDIPFVFYYFRRKSRIDISADNVKRAKRGRLTALISCLLVLALAVNPLQSVLVEKINSVEFFTNHISDIYDTAMGNKMEEVSAEEVIKTVKDYTEPLNQAKLQGIAAGKNLIVIQLEAFQNFLLGAYYNGQELTPNLNELLKKDTIYFDHYYSTIGKGNTVDAEFSSMNSLYPVIDAECYRLYQDNTYNGLPWLLKDQGYRTLAVHGYEGQFWNRRSAYPSQGIDSFYSMEDLEQDEKIGLGISDKSMFRQAADLLTDTEQPFFSFIITLTNHHPFLMDEEEPKIRLLPEHEGTKFGNYLQTVHYTDEAVGEFIEGLKEDGLYDKTAIALYGDHHGLNSQMDDNDVYVSDFLGREYDFDEMMKVPLIIHVPGSGVNETISTVGGQIDFMPTIANLMNLNPEQPYILGQDLVNAKEGFAAFTAYLFEGSFVKDHVMFEVSREGIFEGSRAWDIDTGRELDASLYRADYDRALALKAASRNILEQNLLSDYTNK